MADKKKRKKQKTAPKSFIDQAALPMAVVGAVCILVGLSWWAIQDKFAVGCYIFCGVGLALIGVAVASKPAEVKSLITSRQMAMGTNTSVSILAVLGILVFVNYLGIRHHHRFDLTKRKQHTLSEQTVKILRGLKQPVEATAFYSPDSRDYGQMEDLLREYEAHSRKLKGEVVNVLLSPDKAQQMNVNSPGTTVVMCGTKREEVSFANEQSLTSAILKVTRDQKKKIYFLAGHGEHDVDDSDQSKGYSEAKSSLEKLNYEVDRLSLFTKQPTIPNDCNVLVIAGPKTPLAPQEEKLVNDYLDGHGHGLVMLDPDSPPLASIINKWGVEAQAGVLIEPMAQFFFGAAYPVVQKYESHLITDPLRNTMSVFPMARPLRAESAPPSGGPESPSGSNQVTPLIKTTADSWAEMDTGSKQVKFDEVKDTKGPCTIAAAVTSGSPPPPQYPGAPPPPPDNTPKTRLVVFGDSDFATNRALESGANGNLFTNVINWLAEEEDLVSIQPKEPYVTRVDLSKGQIRLVFFLSAIVVPFCVVLFGGFVWWKRR